MTWRARIAFGAACGAMIAFLVHPRSRPVLLLAFHDWGPSEAVRASPYLPQNRAVLSDPQGAIDASLWMQTGAERLFLRSYPSKEALGALVAVARKGEALEPDNGFWGQMEAVFLNALGDRPGSAKAWVRAANAARWNDHQSSRLRQLARSLAAEAGSALAWQRCRAYSLRSPAPSKMIEALARGLVSRSNSDDRRGIDIRLATLRNGVILRDGARWLEASESGVRMIEYAGFPPGEIDTRSPRRLLLARLEFARRIRSAGLSDSASEVERAYLSNDAFLALTGPDAARSAAMRISGASLATAAGPSSLLGASAFGFLLLGIAELWRRFPVLLAVLRPPIAPFLGVVAGVGAFAATGLPLVGMAIGSCFAFLVFGPGKVRSNPPAYLGPFFRFTIVLLALVFTALIATFLTSLTTPAWEIGVMMNLPSEFYGGKSLPLGLSAIVLAMLLLAGPGWGMVLRVPTAQVVLTAVREFGTFTAIGSLFLAIASVPVALAVDRDLEETMTKLLENEPTFYLVK